MRLPVAASVVDWSAILSVIWTSLVAGVGVTGVFALGVLGATRASDLRRNGHAFAAGAYTVLMGLAFAAVVAAVVFGIVVMRQQ